MKTFIIGMVLFTCTLGLFSQNTDTTYLEVAGVKLHTVLTTPSAQSSAPLAIIIAGSGPTDLNGNNPVMTNNSLKYLSEELIANNIATLRFDKRGIAKSAYPNMDEAEFTIDRFYSDVEALIEYGKSKGYKEIFVIGHSEGSLLGIMAIQKQKVKGFVSLAGLGSPADEILKKQVKPQLTPKLFEQTVTILDSLKSGHTVKNVPNDLMALFRPSVQPYMISWLKLNPAVMIKTIGCPALIINGTNDIQVGTDEADKLSQALPGSEKLIIKDMNHILKTVKGGFQANYATYSNPDLPINKELSEGIVNFINKNK